MLDQLERQRPDPFATERQVDDRVRPAPDIDDGRGERLVHRHARLTESMDAGAVAQRLGERDTEHERDVLDGVVLVDLEVAIGRDRQVEQAVVAERPQEVVVEADPRRDRGVAGAVEAERDGHVRLAGGPRDRDAPALSGPDRVLAGGVVMRMPPRPGHARPRSAGRSPRVLAR